VDRDDLGLRRDSACLYVIQQGLRLGEGGVIWRALRMESTAGFVSFFAA